MNRQQNYKETTPDMLIDTIDNKDKVTGVIKRNEVLKSFQNFRVVHVFLFNEKEELLIQKISSKNNRHPFYWGSSVAGYLFAGEEYEAAAVRRIKQELGIDVSNLKFFGKVVMKEETGDKMIGLFTCRYNGEVYPTHDSILKTEFHSLRNIEEMLKNDTRKFTPTFILLFNSLLNPSND